jgi:hypothetical protein
MSIYVRTGPRRLERGSRSGPNQDLVRIAAKSNLSCLTCDEQSGLASAMTVRQERDKKV